VNSNWPRITVITPSYNQGEFLEQTIDSVLSQSYPNLEYFVIDGGSTDQSVDIIKKFQKHLTWWVSEPDQGQSDAINKGIKNASGEAVNWLNSDDYYESGALVSIGEAFKNPETKVVMGRSQIFNEEGVIGVTKGTDTYGNNLAKTIGWARIDQPETFFRRESYESIGRLNPVLRFVMDKEWWIRYLLHFGLKGFCRLDRVLVNFRHHLSSKTISESEGFRQETMRVFISYCQEFGFEEESTVLQQLGNHGSKIQVVYSQGLESEVVRSAIQYYILLAGNEYYHNNQRGKANICFKGVAPSMLEPEDRRLLRKLRFRNRYVPLWLIKFLRKS